MAKHTDNHGYSLRNLRTDINDASVNVCNIMRSHDGFEDVFTAEDIKTGRLEAFVKGTNLFTNTDFESEIDQTSNGDNSDALKQFYIAGAGEDDNTQIMNGIGIASGFNSFYAIQDATLNYATVYPNTTIFIQEDGAGGKSKIKVVGNGNKARAGTFSVKSGDLIFADHHWHAFDNGANDHIIPMEASGTGFLFAHNRYGEQTVRVHGLESNTTVKYYSDKFAAGGIGSTPTTTKQIGRGGEATFTEGDHGTDQGSYSTKTSYITADKPILVSKQAEIGDQFVLIPASDRVYKNRDVNDVQKSALDGTTASEPNDFLITGSEDNPVQATMIGDGEGGTAVQGMPFDRLRDTFAFGNKLSDYHIISPYAGTEVRISGYKESNDTWYLLQTETLDGSLNSPASAFRNGNNETTPVYSSVDPGSAAGSAPNFQVGGEEVNCWKFCSNKPVHIVVNDGSNDELALFGWDTYIHDTSDYPSADRVYMRDGKKLTLFPSFGRKRYTEANYISNAGYRIQQIAQDVKFADELFPFETYTYSVYIKQKEFHGVDNYFVMSAEYGIGTADLQQTKTRIEFYKKGLKRKRRQRTVTETVIVQEPVYLRPYTIFRFGHENNNAAQNTPTVYQKSEDTIAHIENCGNGWYRLGISILLLEPTDSKIVTRMQIMNNRGFANMPVFKPEGSEGQRKMGLNIKTCADFLKLNYPISYSFAQDKIVPSEDLSSVAQGGGSYSFFFDTKANNNHNTCSKFEIFAPQFDFGNRMTDYAVNIFDNDSFDVPAGAAVVTKIYDQFGADSAEQNDNAFTTHHTSVGDKLRFCPRIADKGVVLKNKGRRVMRFFGDQLLHSNYHTSEGNKNVFHSGENGVGFGMHIAFTLNESDGGDGGFDEETSKFRNNYARRQILGTYNLTDWTNRSNNNDLAPKNDADFFSTEQAFPSAFTNRLSGTRFFGVFENGIRYEEFGDQKLRFVSNRNAIFTDNGTVKGYQALERASRSNTDTNLTVNGFGYKTRLAVCNTAEKVEILRDVHHRNQIEDSNHAHWISSYQYDTKIAAEGWVWYYPSKTEKDFNSPLSARQLVEDDFGSIVVKIKDMDNNRSEGRNNVDPQDWADGEPNNAGGSQDYAQIFAKTSWGPDKRSGLWDDVSSTVSRYYYVELNVNNNYVLTDKAKTTTYVASIINDKDGHYRGYLNGTLAFSDSGARNIDSVTGRALFLGNCVTGEPGETGISPIFQGGHGGFSDSYTQDGNFGTGFVGDFMELVIFQKDDGNRQSIYPYLDNYNTLTDIQTSQEAIDANLNSYYGTVYEGRYKEFTKNSYYSRNVSEELREQYGADKENIYNGDWDGTFKEQWTDNPAWILYDLMINGRYGMGDQIDDPRDIDIFNLYNIGRHCDAVDSDGFFEGVEDSKGGLEPRFSFNGAIQDFENAYNLISNVASSFYGLTYWDGGTFHFSADKQKDIMAVFNNQNVFDGAFSYSDLAKNTRFSKVSVNYMDKDDEFKMKVEYVEDEELIRKYGVVEHNVNGFGCTSRGQARRLGKYILYSNKLETESVAFQAGREALMLSPGDIIRIDDELKNFDVNFGKILALNNDPELSYATITIDKEINTGSMITGEEGGFFVYNNAEQNDIKKLYDMVLFNRAETFAGAEYTEVSESLVEGIQKPQISRLRPVGFIAGSSTNFVKINKRHPSYQHFHKIAPGSTFSFKIENVSEQLYRVLKISEESENLYAIEAIKHDPLKFKHIEEDEDFLRVNREGIFEQEGYNIGIPSNTINRPPAPQGFEFNTGLNTIGKVNLTGQITGASAGSETKYRVALFYPTSRYITQEFEKKAGSPPITDFTFYDLEDVGTYTIEVTSLKNPDSSKTIKRQFEIQDTDEVVEDVLYFNTVYASNTEMFKNYYVDGLRNYDALFFDYKTEIDLRLKNQNGKEVSYSSPTQPYYDVVLVNNSGEEYLIADDYNKQLYNFSITDHGDKLNGDLRDFSLRFELSNNFQGAIDSFKINFSNPAPAIENITFHTGIEGVNVFELSMSDKHSKDIQKVQVYTGVSNDDTSYCYTHTTSQESTREYLRIPKEYYATQSGHNTGNIFYQFAPFDSIGVGTRYTGVSGSLTL